MRKVDRRTKEYKQKKENDMQTVQQDMAPVAPVKKGKKVQWKPASRMGRLAVPEGFTGRWCSADETNIQKKQEEGWVMVNKTNYPQGQHIGSGQPDIADSVGLGTTVKYREMIGMMLPDEVREAREEYYQERTRQQTEAVVHVKKTAEDQKVAQSGQFKPTLTID